MSKIISAERLEWLADESHQKDGLYAEQAAELIASHDAANRSLAAARAKNEKLLRFAGEALTDTRLREIGDWEGGDIQDAMLDTGLIEAREMPGPCNPESCQCADYGDFPMTCLRITPLGKEAVAAFRAWQDKQIASGPQPESAPHG